MRHNSRLQSLFLITLLVNILPVSLTSSFEPNSSSMVLTIQTASTYYLRGEIVQILGTVKDTLGFPIEEATVAIEVKNPSNSTIFLDIVYSRSDGSYSDSFRLPSIASVGQYTAYATASKTGYATASKVTTFFVTTNDLYVEYVEPLQVILGASALVEGKATLVRAEIGNGFTYEVATEIELSYEYFTLGGVKTTITRIESCLIPTGRTTLYLPSDSPIYPGKGTFIASIRIDPFGSITELYETNNFKETDAPMSVKDTLSFRILYVPLNFIFESPVIGDRMDVEQYGADIFVKATYPFAYDGYTSVSTSAAIGLFIPSNYLELLDAVCKISLARALLRYDRAVAVVPSQHDPSDPASAWLSNYFLGIPDGAVGTDVGWGPVVIAEEGYWTTVAHELGHSYGIRIEEYKTDYPGRSAQGHWIEPSVNPITGVRTDGPITSGFCFMGIPVYQEYSTGTTKVWIDNDHYEYLLSQFKTDPLDPELLLASGIVFQNGTVNLNPWYRIPQGTPDIELGASGNYSLRFLNGDGEMIGQTGFNVYFFCEGASQNATAFSFTVPYVPATATVQIIHDGVVVATRQVSSNPPMVTVASPNGGEVIGIGTNCTITWEASDVDMDELTYSLAYSEDGGINWLPLALNVKESSYAWNTSQLKKGSNYLVKVIASDGVNTYEDNSDGPITLTVQGDITGDFVVNADDLFALGRAYMTTPSSSNWNRNADINHDLIVNVTDLEILKKNYGKTAT
jgi:hypothetical protein